MSDAVSKAIDKLGENSIKIKGAKLFNSISEEITKLKFTNKFKREITKDILSAYSHL